MFRKVQFHTAIPYALSALALLVVSACAAPTPAATATASPVPATSSGVILVTLAPQTPDNTATPIQPSDTPIPTDYISPTPGPTATLSGSAIPQGVADAKAFNAAAPASVGPFQLVKPNSVSSQYGSTLYYRTEDGALYTIVLWLTNSDADAITRYQLELGNIANPQPLKLGDEAVYSMVDTKELALIHFRNAIIDIYRPDPSGTLPTVKLTDDEVKQLATQLFQSIPK
ncbi:MAG: hypothetical protein ACYDBJ_23620 [Aggregatilineales bacterium]